MLRKLRALLALAATATSAFAAPPATIPTMPPEADQQLVHDIYKQFIEIPSGHDSGGTTGVVEAAAARLRAAGFPDADIFLGGAAPHKFNLVVRYHGTGARKPILLMAHTDVVEAKREDWSMEPFVLHEQDGFFYGRGTTDDKAQAAIWIANLIRYKREGYKPERDIIVALTADEEGGGPYNGAEWLVHNQPQLIAADLALNEGGDGVSLKGKRLYNAVQVSEKYSLNFRLESLNKGGHSSLPIKDNAIYHLADALTRIAAFDFPLKTNDVTSAYFAQMSKIESGPVSADLLAVSQGSQEAMVRVAAARTAWNSSLRTTCVATMLQGGHASNALPQLATANINCRVLPDDTPEYVLDTLRKTIHDDKVSVTQLPASTHGPGSAMRPDLLKAVNDVTSEMWPGVPVVPVMLMGATDGRSTRRGGIPTYGISGLFGDAEDVRAHGRDERLSIQSFYEGDTFLYELVKELASPKKP